MQKPLSATQIMLNVEKYIFTDFGSGWKMLRRTRMAKFDLHLRENRNGPVHRDHMGIWGTTWTLAWYLRRQPNFRGLAPDPPKKLRIFFSSF
jgi:hypothetical protein